MHRSTSCLLAALVGCSTRNLNTSLPVPRRTQEFRLRMHQTEFASRPRMQTFFRCKRHSGRIAINWRKLCVNWMNRVLRRERCDREQSSPWLFILPSTLLMANQPGRVYLRNISFYFLLLPCDTMPTFHKWSAPSRKQDLHANGRQDVLDRSAPGASSTGLAFPAQ